MISPQDRLPHYAPAPSPSAVDSICEPPLLEDANRLSDDLSTWRHDLHRIPELGCSTPQTSRYIQTKLAEFGLDAAIGPSGEVNTLLGGDTGPCLLLRADIDALPMVERSGEPWASDNGCAHSCGHDMHAASLLGAAKLLQERSFLLEQFRGCVKLLFQTGEETLTGAAAAISDGIMDNPRVEAAFAIHVNARCPLGLLIYGEDQSAGVWSFRIRLRGRGGHGSSPQKCINPIVCGIKIHEAIDTFMNSELAPGTEAVLTIGKFSAGASPNVIPDECVLEGTARAFDTDLLNHIKHRVCELVRGVSLVYRVKDEVEDLSLVPPLIVDSALTENCLSYVGAAEPGLKFRGIQHSLGAEDFARFSALVPSANFIIGAAVGDSDAHYSLHDARVRFDDKALPICAAAYASVALGWLSDQR